MGGVVFAVRADLCCEGTRSSCEYGDGDGDDWAPMGVVLRSVSRRLDATKAVSQGGGLVWSLRS